MLRDCIRWFESAQLVILAIIDSSRMEEQVDHLVKKTWSEIAICG